MADWTSLIKKWKNLRKWKQISLGFVLTELPAALLCSALPTHWSQIQFFFKLIKKKNSNFAFLFSFDAPSLCWLNVPHYFTFEIDKEIVWLHRSNNSFFFFLLSFFLHNVFEICWNWPRLIQRGSVYLKWEMYTKKLYQSYIIVTKKYPKKKKKWYLRQSNEVGVFLSYNFPKMRAVNPHQQQSGAGKHKREKKNNVND